MKYLTEYRDAEMVASLANQIAEVVTQSWNIMEICGGQTHNLVKNGIIDMLPSNINLVHGPGCPVCVTPLHMIDHAIHLVEHKQVILCSFGDMMRVPGSKKSLLEVKASGGDVRVVYSPLQAVAIAKENPQRKVVFFAIGFETTAPANALSVLQAQKMDLDNYSILASHVLVPPALEAILSDADNIIDGVLAAGHVCTIMGHTEYIPLAGKYQVPIVVTGFEPIDLLQGILMAVQQLENGTFHVENQYGRFSSKDGNPHARHVVKKVFEICDRTWRGIGTIPHSGYQVRADFERFDANKQFSKTQSQAPECSDCVAGQVLKGHIKPYDCPSFGQQCTPESPLGAPMVSSEGACAAYYHFSHLAVKN